MTAADSEIVARLKSFLGKSESEKISRVTEISEWSRKYATVCPEISSSDFRLFEALGETALYHVSLSKSTGEFSVLRGECQVTFEDVPLSLFVQYRFSEDSPTAWRVAAVTEEALVELKKAMFASWEEQIRRPSCEAAFRRLLQAGPISKVFDKHLFPTPAELKAKFQVVNETTGKLIDLPHPVEGLRVFDAATDAYRDIDPTLDGAPRGEVKTREYFDKLMSELREEFGSDYVAALLEGKSCSS